MKKLLLRVAIPLMAFTFGCQEENVNSTEKKEDGYSIEAATRPRLIIWIEKGTRYRGPKPAPERRAKCAGRSICVRGPVGGGDDEPAGGGVLAYNENYTKSKDHYSAGISMVNGNYEFEVKLEHILPEVSDEVFEGDVFVMDEDFNFPNWVCDYFGESNIVLKKGTYDVTTSSDGTVTFQF